MTASERQARGGMSDTIERLERLAPLWIDGKAWWRQADVRWALRVPMNASLSALVPPEHRRTIAAGQWPHHKRVGLIDRAGVEKLILRYGGRTPRAALLAALDRGGNAQLSLAVPLKGAELIRDG
jgi:hypothetical protein